MAGSKQHLKAELNPALPKGYASVLESLIGKIKNVQTRAMKAVNHELIVVYWDSNSPKTYKIHFQE